MTLDWVITDYGMLPGRGQFERICRAHDIPLGRDVRGWDAVVERTRALRIARGNSMPAAPTLARDWPALPEPDITRSSRRMVKAYSREQILASLRLMATRHLSPGERLTEKRYRAACACDPDLIPSSCVIARGRFQSLVREAGVG